MGYSTPLLLPFRSQMNTTENVLRVAVKKILPYITSNQMGDQVSISGPLRIYLEAMERLLNHSITVTYAGNMDHGVRLENGSFTGFMGLLDQKLIEIFIGPAIMIEERIGLAEAMLLDTSTYRMVTWQPSKWVDPFQFMRVFTIEVWILILLSELFLSGVCWLMERFFTPWNLERKASLTYFLWEVPSRVLSLGHLKRRDGWLRVCLSGFILIFPLVLMNYLNSKLISAMTIKQDEDFVNKYEDVLRFPKVRIYSEAGSSFALMFTDPRTETFRKLRTRFTPTRGIFSQGPRLVEIMSEVAAKKRVITCNPEICHALIIRLMKIRGRCLNVMMTTESSGFILGSWFVSNAVPRSLRGSIRAVSFTVFESQLYKELMLFTSFAGEKCSRQKGISMKPLVPQDIEGSFIMLTIGLSAAVVASIVEMISHPTVKSRRILL